MGERSSPSTRDRGELFRRHLVVGVTGTLALFLLVLGLLDFAFGNAFTAPGLFIGGIALILVSVWMNAGRIAVEAGLRALLAVFAVIGLGLIIVTAGRLTGVYLSLPVLTMMALLVETRRGWVVGWLVLCAILIGVGAALQQSEAQPLVDVNLDWIQWAPYRMPFILSVLALMIGRHHKKLIAELNQEAEESIQRWRRVSARAVAEESRFEDFASLAADWFWETDEQHRLTYLSPGFEAMTGLRVDTVLGLRPDQIYSRHAATAESADRQMAPILARRAFSDQVLRWPRADGQRRVLINHGRPIHDGEGRFQGFRGVIHDVTEEADLRRRLVTEAATDELTGLASRQAFMEQAADRLRRCRGAEPAVLLYIDLDRFKPINDQAGHAVGDRILQRVARSIRDMVPEGQLVARMGGDEFCVLLQGAELSLGQRLAESLLAAIRSVRVEADGKGFGVGASIGVACESPVANPRLSLWISAADEAAYQAKRGGRDQVRLSTWGAQ